MFQFKQQLSIVLCAISIFACAGIARADEPPIRIGVIGPVTGKSSTDMGESIVGGARVFANDINQIGGLLGRKVELVERDDRAMADVGVAVSKELVEQQKVVAAVGFGNTGVALPSSKVFQNAKIPLIVTAATGADVTLQFAPPKAPANYIFRLAASDALQPVALIRDVLDRRKLTRIALLHDDSAYGKLGRRDVLAELDKRNVKPVVIDSFKVGDQDMSAQLAKASAAGADVIVLYCLGTEGAMVARSAAKLKLKLPIVGPWGLSQQAYADLAGPAAEGSRMAVTFVEDELSSRRREFMADYRTVNKVTRVPSAVAAAQTYDALRLLSLAIFQAQSTDPQKIQAALENLNFETSSTVISRYKKPFTSTDHEAIGLHMIMMGEIRGGRVQFAYPEDAKVGLVSRAK
jgi:branched-chain amino acid transport system substrate-binding protein